MRVTFAYSASPLSSSKAVHLMLRIDVCLLIDDATVKVFLRTVIATECQNEHYNGVLLQGIKNMD